MRWVCVLLVLLSLPMALFAEEPAQPARVTISLTTTVPELLTHGFLTSGDSTDIIPALTVSDAFNEDGATLYYAIQTNIARPFEVYATVTPFELKNASTPAQVAIQTILVGEQEIAAISGGEYKLIQFNPGSQGMGLTSYILTIIADQDQIESAPSGQYEATVAIDIRSDT
ncbi:hypothetical protein [Sphaerochaeta halotolerans]|uniref:hypothetical protein n=1 Tax=Sphaerochaeta halotolerans TaxID=2293840 RepID=UPI00136BAEBD|nr:hypothetical protein [Sphaerochaeta halotolerans]MBG0767559.1 hypothetical protein [Spirochaetaceae bacterium]MDK2859135.1 hypothetical protein [Sphaerochaeta sp.]MDN5333622.1 hypothetical protein [Sphaerochaeta sp.]MXI87384.1 hypothetical protein [Sphaerochaeta halotolerans]